MKKERKAILLRLAAGQYEKLRRVSVARSIREGRHISMQRIMEDLLETIPDPLPESDETVTAKVASQV
jgi:hypothetical protein